MSKTEKNAKKKPETGRLNVNLSKSLLDNLDKFAEQNNINRTSAVAIAISTFLRENEAMEALKDIASKMPKQ